MLQQNVSMGALDIRRVDFVERLSTFIREKAAR